MFAWPAASLIVVTRLAPFCFVGLPLVVTANDGLKASALQPVAWNGSDASCVAPDVDVSVVAIDAAAQLVGLSMNPCRLMDTVSALSLTGMPATMVLTGAVTVTAAVLWLTVIFARVTTGPRLNGPATAGTTMDIPYGAPS